MSTVRDPDPITMNNMLAADRVKERLAHIIKLGAIIDAKNRGINISENLHEGEIEENLSDAAIILYDYYIEFGGNPLAGPTVLPISSLPRGVVPPERCFDPIMANNVNIDHTAEDMSYFYIMNESGTAISSVACLDAESLDKYQTLEEYLFYKCKETVPNSALFISDDDAEETPYRLFNFSQRVFLTHRDASYLVPGESYILKPTEPIGRIVSYNALGGGNVVGALHCGPADPGNIIYSVDIMNVTRTGGSRKSRKSRRNRKVVKRKTRRNLRRK